MTQKESDPPLDAILHDACHKGSMDKVKHVLDLGQDVNCRGDWRMTPVMEAARCEHRDVVELLLSRGADVSLVDMYGDSTLHWACNGGDVGTMELILSKGMVDVNHRGAGSRTPVMEAARQGHRDVVELLLSRGADVSLVDNDNDNSLHWACGGGDVGTVELILSQNVVEVNCREVGNWTPVMRAALGAHRDVVELLLSRGADMSLVDMDGNNVLHWACMGGDVGLVELILSLNVVDINTRNNYGETATDWARDSGHDEQVDLLVSHGAR
ncbi:inversin-like [Haliotis asinina]|uniref:inversin-like n=1 Tax=Haliotis asinina TaxID=109174 RepID=UPI003532652B